MAIRGGFLPFVAGFTLLFTPGATWPVVASSFGSEVDLAPPGGSTAAAASVLTALAEPAISDPGSGAPADSVEAVVPEVAWSLEFVAVALPAPALSVPADAVSVISALPEPDPWADALADSLRAERATPVAATVPVATAGAPQFPVATNPQVGFFVERFTREKREVVGAWLNRSGRFLGMIRETMKRHGLPEDLAFTAMIESGFNPVAASHAGAKGLWQFMAATARRYGLRVDAWVDERLDPEKSTSAAAAYLRDLYNLFGSWSLAQAAYNAGENTIARAIRATGSSDFWALTRTGFLRRETKEFVPQIHAATIIGREPARFGFVPVLPAIPAIDRVSVPGETDLRWLSANTGIPVDALRALNPVLVRGITPPGSPFELKVPAGTSPEVLAALDRPQRAARASSVVRARSERTAGGVHVVRPRDTVDSIARRYGVSTGEVVRWNGLARPESIRPGDRLRVAAER